MAAQLLGLEVRSGRRHDVGLQPPGLELDPLGLEALLGDDACLLAGHLGLGLGRAGERLELGLTHPERVLLLDDLQVCLGGCDLGPLAGQGLGLLGLGLALRLGDPGLLQHLRGLAAADRVEVADLVGDVLDLEDVELEPEGLDVVVGLVDEGLRELQAVLVHLLGCQGGEHAPEVRLEGLLGDRLRSPTAGRRGSVRPSSAAAPRCWRP